ncbi:MAG: acylphosphatase [Candidatus Methanomarinus sp.]|uniref:Acylphosphatase n=1 Tax=Candidatus Methanomarinus sp. TaxID=3386244 RepID=A0AC61SAS0_9EURY|nr:MAG: acylphosphatase [ANME-2 cluster archaeon]
MKRAVIHVKGRVQRVGYRDEVEEIARQLEIAGFVKNIEPYDVQIIAEGEDSNIEQFIRQIKIKRFPINVEMVEVQLKEFKSEFEYFKIKRGEWQEEIGERLDMAGKLLHKSIELSTESVIIGNKMLDKQDDMLDKQDKMLEKQDESIVEIKGLRQDLKSYMEERFDSLEHEIVMIKEKIGMM